MPPRLGVCAAPSLGARAEPRVAAMDSASAAIGRFIPVTYFVCLQKLRNDAEGCRRLQPEVRDAMPPCMAVGRSVRGWSRPGSTPPAGSRLHAQPPLQRRQHVRHLALVEAVPAGDGVPLGET